MSPLPTPDFPQVLNSYCICRVWFQISQFPFNPACTNRNNILKWWKEVSVLSPRSYLQWTRGTGRPGVFQTGLYLLRLHSLRVHAFQRRTSMLEFAVVLSNHWCTARGTQMTHDDEEDKNKTMRKETLIMG